MATAKVVISKLVFFKGIFHFEINFWYVLAYLKDIQDVGVFVSAVVSIIKSSNQIMFNLDFSVHAL